MERQPRAAISLECDSTRERPWLVLASRRRRERFALRLQVDVPRSCSDSEHPVAGVVVPIREVTIEAASARRIPWARARRRATFVFSPERRMGRGPSPPPWPRWGVGAGGGSGRGGGTGRGPGLRARPAPLAAHREQPGSTTRSQGGGGGGETRRRSGPSCSTEGVRFQTPRPRLVQCDHLCRNLAPA